MIEDLRVGVIGGDRRNLVCANQLALEGIEVSLFGIDTTNQYNSATKSVDLEGAIVNSDAVILGVPYSIDKGRINANTPITIKELIKTMSKGQLLLGGRFDFDLYSLAKQKGIKAIDYFDDEELITLNSIPTAEGAVEVAMKELDITLHSSNALVLGYGRIGQTMAHTLKNLGARVSVAVRNKSDFARIKIMGYEPVDIYKLDNIKDADVIFNTVPARVLGEETLKKLSPATLIIDLASSPGGVDMKTAQKYGNKVVWALSLPGKTAPITAGKIIKDTVLKILTREGLL